MPAADPRLPSIGVALDDGEGKGKVLRNASRKVKQ